MKLILESTTKIGSLNIDGVSVPARIWIGKTERGTECFAFIPRIAVADGKEEEFDSELKETPFVPGPPESLPLRLFLD